MYETPQCLVYAAPLWFQMAFALSALFTAASGLLLSAFAHRELLSKDMGLCFATHLLGSALVATAALTIFVGSKAADSIWTKIATPSGAYRCQ
jgi:hypothetical protein